MAFRKQKLEGQIKRIISELIIKEIKDPRIGFVTITGVELSKDLSQAKVGVSILGDTKDIKSSFSGILSAKGFIQHKVGKSLMIRQIPKIEFFIDSSISDGTDMVGLIDSLNISQDEEDAEPISNDE